MLFTDIVRRRLVILGACLGAGGIVGGIAMSGGETSAVKSASSAAPIAFSSTKDTAPNVFDAPAAPEAAAPSAAPAGDAAPVGAQRSGAAGGAPATAPAAGSLAANAQAASGTAAAPGSNASAAASALPVDPLTPVFCADGACHPYRVQMDVERSSGEKDALKQMTTAGEKGERGPAGAAGPAGKAGAPGPRGEPGKDGATGPAGPAGPSGSAAAKGDTGAKGDRGSTGAQGPQGPAGSDGKDGVNGLAGRSAYQVAVANGFVGTQAVWLASLQGADGVNGRSAYQLAVAGGYGGTQAQWLASLKGATGANGRSAYEIAVAGGYVGSEAAWLASLNGTNGTNGTNGNNGTNGKSAYEIAVAGGYSGSQAAWLASLNGTNGTNGTNGKSAYEIAVAGGYSGTQAAWLASLNGTNGTNGKSAYEIAVAGGYSGTESAWLASLKGTNGTNGTNGIDGRSAYELAVAAGFVGTQSDWFASLVGPQGRQGLQWKGAFDSLGTTVYGVDDAVSYGGSSWISRTSPNTSTPSLSPGSGWDPLALKGADGVVATNTSAAGGDLTGYYPSPSIATGVVTSAKIQDLGILDADIASGAVNSDKILDGSIRSSDLGALDGELKFVRPGTGAVLSNRTTTSATSPDFVIDGSGMIGWGGGGAAMPDVHLGRASLGVLEVNGSLSVTNSLNLSGSLNCLVCVRQGEIAANAVENFNLVNDAVTSTKIADRSVEPQDLAVTPGVELGRNTDWSVPSGANGAIPFNLVLESSSVTMNVLPTNNFQISVAGRYLITAKLRFPTNVDGASQLMLVKNGNTVEPLATDSASSCGPSCSDPVDLSVSTQERLRVNDTIAVFVYQNSGSIKAVKASSIELAATWVSNCVTTTCA